MNYAVYLTIFTPLTKCLLFIMHVYKVIKWSHLPNLGAILSILPFYSSLFFKLQTQKEHYLNYRKIFLHDTKNIFEREKKAVKPKVLPEHFGPSPFSGLSNAAAVAMASALTKSQQPPTAAPPVAGLGTLGQTTGGFGSTGLFGATTTTAPAFGNFFPFCLLLVSLYTCSRIENDIAVISLCFDSWTRIKFIT